MKHVNNHRQNSKKDTYDHRKRQKCIRGNPNAEQEEGHKETFRKPLKEDSEHPHAEQQKDHNQTAKTIELEHGRP